MNLSNASPLHPVTPRHILFVVVHVIFYRGALVSLYIYICISIYIYITPPFLLHVIFYRGALVSLSLYIYVLVFTYI